MVTVPNPKKTQQKPWKSWPKPNKEAGSVFQSHVFFQGVNSLLNVRVGFFMFFSFSAWNGKLWSWGHFWHIAKWKWRTLNYGWKMLKVIEFAFLVSDPKWPWLTCQWLVSSYTSWRIFRPWSLRSGCSRWVIFPKLSSWWFQPIWKILVKLGIFPNLRWK